ncbi:putative SH3 domain-containing protein [Seiridium unicorne]|uniref:SH3 domain-containing protein n=1 Tax=Seiridium unicorne TaxID=138068 RepID=A0ABR2UHW6_9PEZI
MADEIERLVLSPFREIAEKADTAVQNAEAADEDISGPMRKAAQSLAKEGERALKRVEPLCNKNFEEYGANFVDAMKEHEEIAQFRAELEDLLWDFDDFVEVDEFDGDKFEELQKASRRAAPRIVDILKRIKLVAPAAAPTPPVAVVDSTFTAERASIIVDPPSGSSQGLAEVEQQLNEMLVMGSQAGPDLGVDGMIDSRANSRAASRPVSDLDRNSSHRSTISAEPLEPPPRPPSTDPWQVDSPLPLTPNARFDDGSPIERRPPVLGGDSPTLPPVLPIASSRDRSNSYRRDSQRSGADSRQYHAVTSHNDPDSAYWRDRAPNGRLRGDSLSKSGSYEKPRQSYSSYGSNELPRYSSQSLDSISDTSRSPTNASPHFGNPSLAIPEDSAVNSYTHRPGYITGVSNNFPPRQASLAAANHQPARPPSMDSLNSSIFDCVTDYGPASPVASTQRTSSVLSTTPGSPYSAGGQLPHYSTPPPGYRSPLLSPVESINNHSSATLATIHARPQTSSSVSRPLPATSQPFQDPGLIPVDSETPESPQMPPRQSDCSIGPHSSFYQMKGFCKGAEGIMRGDLGFKKTRRPVGGYSHTTVAKCTDCLYELDFASVEQDVNNDPKGNFISNSVGFRLRLLQKSHLPIRHIEEQLYGCVFCIHEGRTLDESDATVFFSQKQLFAHMIRHPRPLPKIPGLTVVEGSDIPETFRNNYDVHFTNPPLQSVMSGIAPEVSKLPTAIATETRRNAHGIMRSPPDRGAVLQFAVGARIVGIEFPAKYEGKWGIGWHDGVRAAFEAESVHLDAPPKNETRMQGTSSMQAVARWKWSQKGEGNWLKFSQGDVIKNISWTYSDHWCWSGTSGKGWGIFPQSHLEPHSVKIIRPGDDMSVISNERKSALGLFSMKRSTEKKPDKKKKEKVERESGRKLASPAVAATS